jgi:uncharacterized membrane protein
MNEQRKQKDQATYAMLVVLLFFCGFLLFLVSAVIPGAVWLVVIVVLFGLLFLLQYLLWGRRLTEYLQHNATDDSEAEREHLKKYGPHE